MLTLYVNGNLGNQEVEISDGTTGQLSGIRIGGSVLNNNSLTIQWTFVSVGGFHEGFVFAGSFEDGMIIDSINGTEKYQIKFR
ncbi:hypothetical protein [Lentilactobacillus sp. SPB1-3]|uniref:Uncharacterized protein n=1 Tax=Lentilactobacillus terminaliae TaxID=3003483 RepID=A0ACD5DCL9_9LACO|nr:hypothetical protein [Lentilactobacillus sp. SPB1-3]MCZ0977329.1 hypothetical protein [Lentilactobacillus sp. SPB1-3]